MKGSGSARWLAPQGLWDFSCLREVRYDEDTVLASKSSWLHIYFKSQRGAGLLKCEVFTELWEKFVEKHVQDGCRLYEVREEDKGKLDKSAYCVYY